MNIDSQDNTEKRQRIEKVKEIKKIEYKKLNIHNTMQMG